MLQVVVGKPHGQTPWVQKSKLHALEVIGSVERNDSCVVQGNGLRGIPRPVRHLFNNRRRRSAVDEGIDRRPAAHSCQPHQVVDVLGIIGAAAKKKVCVLGRGEERWYGCVLRGKGENSRPSKEVVHFVVPPPVHLHVGNLKQIISKLKLYRG